jgi:hypothetical protein
VQGTDTHVSLDVLVNDLENFPANMEHVKRNALRIIGEEYKVDFALGILIGESPDGSSFAPLLPQSKYPRRRQRDPANHVLWDKGDLVKSFRFRAPTDSVTIYTEDPKAEHHQKGTTKMVARPIVGFSRRANRRIADRLEALKTTDESIAFIECLVEALNGAEQTEE